MASTNGTEELPREDLVRGVIPFEIREYGGDNDDLARRPTMAGYFARFNEWTEIDSWFEGHFMESFAPGAFRKTIRENAQRMRVLFQHGRDPQVGDKPLGPIDVLREDDQGPYYEVPLLDAPYVNEQVLPGLEADLYGASFRFSVVKEEFNQEPEKSRHNPDGIPERVVSEARVFEFGPVTFPAYEGATAGLRSLTDEFVLARFAREPERLLELVQAAKREPQHSGREPETSTPAAPSRSTQTDKAKRFSTREEWLRWIQET